MNTDQIYSSLTRMKLSGMAQGWQSLVETRSTGETSLTEGLELLLQAEIEQRLNRKFQRLQKDAKFRYQASIEELNFDPARGLDKSMVTTLARGTWIEKGEALLVTGAAGCGKSFLISALGARACELGYSVSYFNMQKLLIKLKMARVDGTIIKVFEKIAKTRLLILDDFGLTHISGQTLLDVMEIIEDRHAKTSTIIASQLPVAGWYDIFGEELIADSICDRLVHTSHRIEFKKGESLRKKQ